MNGSGRDMEKAEDLKRAYAAAPADEPPSALDDRIIAEARRVVQKPAARAWQGAWGPALAVAAVLVLGVFVVFQMQGGQPAMEGAGMIASEKPSAGVIALAPSPQGSATTNNAATSVAPPRNAPVIVVDAIPAGNASGEARSETAQAAMLVGRDRPSERPERPMVARSLASVAAPALPSTELAMRKADETPEAWLRRLADLRQQGRTKEFDEGLAEFRKRHPGYRIPEALLAPR